MEIDYKLGEPQFVAPTVRHMAPTDLPVCATCAMRWWAQELAVGVMCICTIGNNRTYPFLDFKGCEMWSLAEPEPVDDGQ